MGIGYIDTLLYIHHNHYIYKYILTYNVYKYYIIMFDLIYNLLINSFSIAY